MNGPCFSGAGVPQRRLRHIGQADCVSELAHNQETSICSDLCTFGFNPYATVKFHTSVFRFFFLLSGVRNAFIGRCFPWLRFLHFSILSALSWGSFVDIVVHQFRDLQFLFVCTPFYWVLQQRISS